MANHGSFRILFDTCKTCLTDEARRLSEEQGYIAVRPWARYRHTHFTRLSKEGHGHDEVGDAMRLASEEVMGMDIHQWFGNQNWNLIRFSALTGAQSSLD